MCKRMRKALYFHLFVGFTAFISTHLITPSISSHRDIQEVHVRQDANAGELIAKEVLGVLSSVPQLLTCFKINIVFNQSILGSH